MHVINATNVNDALHTGLHYLLQHGVEETSRNGTVLVAPGPVTTVYTKPWQRVLFSPLRDANPFFHFMESLWMLAGRNDLAFLQQFASKFGAYSDDGKTIRGAYGHRWRQWFGYDQLRVLVEELRSTPDTRRAVLAMWDAGEFQYPDQFQGTEDGGGDLLATTVDKPCNTHIYFDVRGGVLNMTVCCRSNDVLWGAYGANAVHMSFLQEYIAVMVDVPMGAYRQVSNNYHMYLNVVSRERAAKIAEDALLANFYDSGSFSYVPLGGLDEPPTHLPGGFDYALRDWFSFHYDKRNHGRVPFKNDLLQRVATPMYMAWEARKLGLSQGAVLDLVDQIHDTAWRVACRDWMLRRYNKGGQLA